MTRADRPSRSARREPARSGLSVWRRLTAFAGAVGALAVTVVLLGVAPVLMWRWVGWPLPHQGPSWAQTRTFLGSPFTTATLVDVLGCLFWYTYAALLLSFTGHTAAAVAGIRLPHLPGSAPTRLLAAALTGTVITGLTLALTRGQPATASPGAGPDLTPAAYRTTTTAPVAGARSTGSPETIAPQPAAAGLPVCTVQRYDSLWGLAATHLGDGRSLTRFPGHLF